MLYAVFMTLGDEKNINLKVGVLLFHCQFILDLNMQHQFIQSNGQICYNRAKRTFVDTIAMPMKHFSCSWRILGIQSAYCWNIFSLVYFLCYSSKKAAKEKATKKSWIIHTGHTLYKGTSNLIITLMDWSLFSLTYSCTLFS